MSHQAGCLIGVSFKYQIVTYYDYWGSTPLINYGFLIRGWHYNGDDVGRVGGKKWCRTCSRPWEVPDKLVMANGSMGNHPFCLVIFSDVYWFYSQVSNYINPKFEWLNQHYIAMNFDEISILHHHFPSNSSYFGWHQSFPRAIRAPKLLSWGATDHSTGQVWAPWAAAPGLEDLRSSRFNGVSWGYHFDRTGFSWGWNPGCTGIDIITIY